MFTARLIGGGRNTPSFRRRFTETPYSDAQFSRAFGMPPAKK